MKEAKHRTIYLIRHGRPAYPDQRKYCLGRTDWPLSEQGVREAAAVGAWFAKRPLTAVYSSPLTRCVQTAHYLCAQPQLEPELREIDMGEWDGLPFDEIKERWPQQYQERWHDLVDYVIPGGESFRQLQQRVERVWSRLVAESAGDIALVAHVGVNRVILCGLLGRPLAELFEIRQPTGCVDIISQRGAELRVEQLGLQPLASEVKL